MAVEQTFDLDASPSDASGVIEAGDQEAGASSSTTPGTTTTTTTGASTTNDNEALKLADELESLKANGAKFVAAHEWDPALAQYDRVLRVAEEKKSILTADFDAERRAEKCVLACLSNKALCQLKLLKYDDAKSTCTLALERHRVARVPDPSGKAKVLFRRGQACLGLDDARAAVDAMAEAIEIEEQSLGAQNKEAALRTSLHQDKSKIALIHAMKRELLKARKIAKVQDKKATDRLGHKVKGFLSANSKKSITDPKIARKEAFDFGLDRAIEATQSDDPATRKYAATVLLDSIAKHREQAKDAEGKARGAFAEGFAAFVASEMLLSSDGSEEATEKIKACQKRASDALQECWRIRDVDLGAATLAAASSSSTSDLDVEVEPLDSNVLFAPIGRVCALECTGHALLRAKNPLAARTFLEAYTRAARQIGELPAYHNLPDSFLLQRGMKKMDDKGRRAFRWKYRGHQARAIFDALAAAAGASRDLDDKNMSLKYAWDTLEVAQGDAEMLRAAHNNLGFLYGAAWGGGGPDSTTAPSDDDADRSRTHNALSLAYGAEFERKKKAEEDEKNKKTREPVAKEDFDNKDGEDDEDEVEDDDDDDGPPPEEEEPAASPKAAEEKSNAENDQMKDD